MIIAFDTKHKIGEVYTPKRLVRDNEYMKPQPLFIIRESNLEEYLKEYPQNNKLSNAFKILRYFYEVSTD